MPPRPADSIVVDGLLAGGPHRFGSAYCAVDEHVSLIHRGKLLRMPLATAIAMRDALSRAIDIPVKAADLAAFGRGSG